MTRAIRDAAQALLDSNDRGEGCARRDLEGALRVALAAPEPADDERVAGDEWKLAVDYELVTCGATADSFDTPARAVKELIDWHVRVALDPAVSGDAAALVERGRKEASAGDAGMPVVATEYVCKRPGRVSVYASVDDTGHEHRDEKWSTVEAYPLVRQRDAQAAIAARDARIAEHASDGEMLDWLVRKGTMHVGGSDARGWMVSDMRNGLVILSRGHATYRDAIRAAMKGTPS